MFYKTLVKYKIVNVSKYKVIEIFFRKCYIILKKEKESWSYLHFNPRLTLYKKFYNCNEIRILIKLFMDFIKKICHN